MSPDITGGAQIIDRLLITDSVFSFFPYGEISFQDPVGIGIEAGGPIEECKFSIEFGSIETTPFRIGMSLERVDYPEVYPESSIKGTLLLYLKSFYANSNVAGKNLYTGLLQNAIRSSASSLGLNSINISEFSNTGTWLQGGKRIKDFIINHSRYANSVSQNPVFTFINNKDEFYFSTLSDLFSNEPVSTIPYRLVSTSEDSPDILDFNRITGIQVAYYGNKKNDENYSKTLHVVNNNMVSNSTSSSILQQLNVNIQNLTNPKMPFLSSKIESNRSENNYGIEWDATKKLYQGWKSDLFKDSSFPYRIVLNVPFNPDISAGKILPVEIYTAIPNVEGQPDNTYRIAPEFSGNWLILESTLIWSNKLATPYHKLIIGRPKLSFNRENPNAGSFAS